MSSWPGRTGGSWAAGAGAGAGLDGGGFAVCAQAGAAVTSAPKAALPRTHSLRPLPLPMFTLHKPRLLKSATAYQSYDTPAIGTPCEFQGESVQAWRLGR